MPGDVGCSEFSVSFIRSRSFSRVVRNSITSRNLRAPTATNLPNTFCGIPVQHRSPEAVSEAVTASLRVNGSTGLSSVPLTEAKFRKPCRPIAGCVPQLRFTVDSKAAPLVDADIISEGSPFRDVVWHDGTMRYVCKDSVSDWKRSVISLEVRHRLPFPGLPHARWQMGRITELLQASAVSRTRPQIRVSDEKGNADQCPPTGGKSDCHR